MKNKFILLLLLAVIGLPFGGFSQEYVPIPDSSANWLVLSQNSEYNTEVLQFIKQTNSDTLIEDILYTKIYNLYLSSYFKNDDIILSDNVEYAGAYRNTTQGKVFFVPPQSQITNPEEVLLFDFSANLSDTIHDVAIHLDFGYWGKYDFIVDTVKYFSINNNELKIIHIRSIDNEPPIFEIQTRWVESIGNQFSGLFNQQSNGLQSHWLKCISFRDTIVYQNWNYDCLNLTPDCMPFIQGNCIEFTNVKDNKSSLDFTISPNPFKNSINIKGLISEKTKVSLINIIGQVVYWQTIETSDGFCIETGDLPKGIYILTIYSNKTSWKQKIVKQ